MRFPEGSSGDSKKERNRSVAQGRTSVLNRKIAEPHPEGRGESPREINVLNSKMKMGDGESTEDVKSV